MICFISGLVEALKSSFTQQKKTTFPDEDLEKESQTFVNIMPYMKTEETFGKRTRLQKINNHDKDDNFSHCLQTKIINKYKIDISGKTECTPMRNAGCTSDKSNSSLVLVLVNFKDNVLIVFILKIIDCEQDEYIETNISLSKTVTLLDEPLDQEYPLEDENSIYATVEYIRRNVKDKYQNQEQESCPMECLKNISLKPTIFQGDKVLERGKNSVGKQRSKLNCLMGSNEIFTLIWETINWPFIQKRNAITFYDAFPLYGSTSTEDIETDFPNFPEHEKNALEHTSPIDAAVQVLGVGTNCPRYQEGRNYNQPFEEERFNQSQNVALSTQRDCIFDYESVRRKTFIDWPVMSISPTILARNGWVAEGGRGMAKCYICKVVRKEWGILDEPEHYHEPTCRYVDYFLQGYFYYMNSKLKR